MATIVQSLPIPAGRPAPRQVFEHVLCAVDGSSGDAAAIEYAFALAPCAADLNFIAIAASATGGATIEEAQARRALEQARSGVLTRGDDAGTRLVVSDGDVAAELIARAGPGSLLIAGADGAARARGALMASVATSLAHRSPGPLLIARPLQPALPARQRILVAVDDSAAATELVRLAGSIAATCDAFVHLVHVADRDYGTHTRHRLAELSTALILLTGAEPVVDVARGSQTASCIVELARRCDSSLVVVGRDERGLGAVSAQVVPAAPCSVLVVPVAPAS